ncbi:MAG TPA: ABC transporter ATP-binding protein [Firmicutes bacterium]|nr:ABC transporter ATP-binding protein [Bacillota bacterium]
MSSSGNAIEIVNVTKIYNSGEVKVHALRGVSLTVSSGEFIAIMGPSGSGKSTLMNIIGCLDRPTSGSYLLDGKEVSTLSSDELAEVRNKKLGFVFQTFNLLPKLTAVENVELPLVYAGVSLKERRERAMAALRAVGLGDRWGHRPNQLSGGQAQRVAVARALVNNPSIILADEPTGNLDSKSGKDVMNLLMEMNKTGITIVMVTHDSTIASFAERVIYIRDGEIVPELSGIPPEPGALGTRTL